MTGCAGAWGDFDVLWDGDGCGGLGEGVNNEGDDGSGAWGGGGGLGTHLFTTLCGNASPNWEEEVWLLPWEDDAVWLILGDRLIFCFFHLFAK